MVKAIRNLQEEYNMRKFVGLCFVVILIALGTQAKEFIDRYPTVAVVCASVGNFAWGFFTNGKRERDR